MKTSHNESVRNGGRDTVIHMIVLASLVLIAVAVFSVPIVDVAAADADRFNATNWDSSGTGSHSISDASNGGVAFNWDTDGFSGSWNYVSTAQRNETVKVDWSFRGCHSFFRSDAKAYIYADGPDGETRDRVSDTGGCSFSDSGRYTVEVHKGYDYGVEVTGSHADRRRQMDGTFTLHLNEDVDSVEIEPGTSQTVKVGDSVEFKATALNAAGNIVEESNEAFEWQNTDDSGVFEAVEAGTYEVTATYDGVRSAATEVVVSEIPNRRELSRGQDRETRHRNRGRTGEKTDGRTGSGSPDDTRGNADRERRNRGR